MATPQPVAPAGARVTSTTKLAPVWAFFVCIVNDADIVILSRGQQVVVVNDAVPSGSSK